MASHPVIAWQVELVCICWMYGWCVLSLCRLGPLAATVWLQTRMAAEVPPGMWTWPWEGSLTVTCAIWVTTLLCRRHSGVSIAWPLRTISCEACAIFHAHSHQPASRQPEGNYQMMKLSNSPRVPQDVMHSLSPTSQSGFLLGVPACRG